MPCTQSALEPEAAGGPVLSTGPNDHVFVYYADHGAPGILGMPWGPFLYADQLISTLEKKTKSKCVFMRCLCSCFFGGPTYQEMGFDGF